MTHDTWNETLVLGKQAIRDLDRRAQEELGISGLQLMEQAGATAAAVVRDRLSPRRVTVVCGPGNNGGDGFVVARLLACAGVEVQVVTTGPDATYRGDAAANLRILRTMHVPLHEADTLETTALQRMLRHSDVVVDALLGTGLSRTVEGVPAQLIAAINAARVPTVALDIPSGLDADTGTPLGQAVRADITVTFGHCKPGLLLYPGAALCGDVITVPIGIPGFLSEQVPIAGRRITEAAVRPSLPPRPKDAHKGTFGHLVVLAGSPGKSGAAVMAAQAALRSGVGLVTVATTAGAHAQVESKCTEAMVETIIDRPDAALTEKDIAKATTVLDGKSALAVGPGLTSAPGISALLKRILLQIEIPAVVDADGINILAADPSTESRIAVPLVYTPHPGEMARLTNKSVAQVQADRIGVAKEAAQWRKAVVVLKGAPTVVASPAGDVFLNTSGNTGMATAGSGDVLCGVVGSLMAQGLSPLDAALCGVYVHGLAGDLAAAEHGQVGMVATDIAAALPRAFRRLTGA